MSWGPSDDITSQAHVLAAKKVNFFTCTWNKLLLHSASVILSSLFAPCKAFLPCSDFCGFVSLSGKSLLEKVKAIEMPLAVELPRKSPFSFSEKTQLFFCVRERDIFPWVLILLVIWEKTFQIAVIGNKNKQNVEIFWVLILCNTWWRKSDIGPDALDQRCKHFAPRSVAYVLIQRNQTLVYVLVNIYFFQHSLKGLKSSCGYIFICTIDTHKWLDHNLI